MTKPQILVFAYSQIGYTSLQTLIALDLNLVGVFTHEDNPNENRWFPSVAELAKAHEIPVFTPDNCNDPEVVEHIRELQPDRIFSFYYRQMISPAILDCVEGEAFNLHGSLLPKYRGRAPVNWAILHGETETGVTLHYMVKKPDAGDIVDQLAVPIAPTDTAKDVTLNLAEAANTLLRRQIPLLLSNTHTRQPQDDTQATYFGRRTPEDGRIDWTQSAVTICNLIRAVTDPYPGAFTVCDGESLRIWAAKAKSQRHTHMPGTVISRDPLTIAASGGIVEVERYDSIC